MRQLVVAVAGGLAACVILGGLTACADSPSRTATKAMAGNTSYRISDSAARQLPGPLYGVTVDDVTHLGQIITGLRHLPEMPTTRIYFDTHEPAGYYAPAVRALRPVSYLMGELLDSSDEARISTSAYDQRVKSYLASFREDIDLWEIGNEVNLNGTGRYPTVRAKLAAAYQDVAAQGGRTALTLYYNIGCGDGPGELDPLAFSRAYVPRSVRDGLGYVLLSYYEDACHGIRPSAGTWTAYFRKLHALYPRARVGFGEIGMNSPVTAKTLSSAKSLVRYYYGLAVRLPYYVGGYFWWYFAEDGLPDPGAPLWAPLRAGIQAEARSLGRPRQ